MYKFMHIVIDTIIFVILPKDTGKQCYISLSFQLPSPPLHQTITEIFLQEWPVLEYLI